ncbi:hypothetical protein [Flavobacterium sp. GT3R68]|uniref:hypothetical protein n=1 Tax=Flavobacterium sp. GT3R68 TaxID=2594437 RepID=UPI000F860CFE|nr:hypothetical protein [Flavobacterium sp. GT3R68]RTY91328.1 hypothetical protein EKL32_19050 [Flavobacterium sp. GSN2]TRW93954.1 hypothetical protein FNW07_03315 [Flavobacterium sp. GT3R68]
MRKLFIVLASFFTVLGIIFTILPLGTIALIPIALALLFALLVLIKSEATQKKFPIMLLILSALTLFIVIGREAFVKDEVIVDTQFDQKKIESKTEAKKDLEELEGM